MPGKSEKKKTTTKRNNARRATVGDLLKSQQDKKKAKATDLESRFRNRLQSICKCTHSKIKTEIVCELCHLFDLRFAPFISYPT